MPVEWDSTSGDEAPPPVKLAQDGQDSQRLALLAAPATRRRMILAVPTTSADPIVQ